MHPDNQQDDAHWSFKNEGQPASPGLPLQQPAKHHEEPVTWTASEFIDHQKNAGWYFLLALFIAALCGLIYFLTKDIISIIAIVIAVFLYLVVSGAKPQQRTYSIDQQGITIDGKNYPFAGFKSFAVSQEGAIGCISFIPLKRLMPELSIYFAPEDADRITDVLAASLPNDQRKEHGIDRLAKRLHL